LITAKCPGLLEKKMLYLSSVAPDVVDGLSVQAEDVDVVSPSSAWFKRACVLTSHDIYLALPPADGLVDADKLTTKEALSAIPLESIIGVSYGGNLHLVDAEEVQDVTYILDVVTFHHKQTPGKLNRKDSRRGEGPQLVIPGKETQKTGIGDLHVDHKEIGRPSLRFKG